MSVPPCQYGKATRVCPELYNFKIILRIKVRHLHSSTQTCIIYLLREDVEPLNPNHKKSISMHSCHNLNTTLYIIYNLNHTRYKGTPSAPPQKSKLPGGCLPYLSCSGAAKPMLTFTACKLPPNLWLKHIREPLYLSVLLSSTFTSEPNIAGIYRKNNPEKCSPHFPIYSAIASHVLTFTV